MNFVFINQDNVTHLVEDILVVLIANSSNRWLRTNLSTFVNELDIVLVTIVFHAQVAGWNCHFSLSRLNLDDRHCDVILVDAHHKSCLELVLAFYNFNEVTLLEVFHDKSAIDSNCVVKTFNILGLEIYCMATVFESNNCSVGLLKLSRSNVNFLTNGHFLSGILFEELACLLSILVTRVLIVKSVLIEDLQELLTFLCCRSNVLGVNLFQRERLVDEAFAEETIFPLIEVLLEKERLCLGCTRKQVLLEHHLIRSHETLSGVLVS